MCHADGQKNQKNAPESFLYLADLSEPLGLTSRALTPLTQPLKAGLFGREPLRSEK